MDGRRSPQPVGKGYVKTTINTDKEIFVSLGAEELRSQSGSQCVATAMVRSDNNALSVFFVTTSIGHCQANKQAKPPQYSLDTHKCPYYRIGTCYMVPCIAPLPGLLRHHMLAMHPLEGTGIESPKLLGPSYLVCNLQDFTSTFPVLLRPPSTPRSPRAA